MSKKAVLVIDMQLGIFVRKEYDGVAVYNENQFLENVAAIITKARDAGVPLIYIQHIYKNLPIMEKGQPLWNVHPAIAPLEGEAVVEKHHADAFYDTDLEKILQQKGVDTLIITGAQTEYCVDTTCRRAHSMGYKCIWVADGHSTYDSNTLTADKIIAHHNEIIGSQFADVVNASDVQF